MSFIKIHYKIKKGGKIVRRGKDTREIAGGQFIDNGDGTASFGTTYIKLIGKNWYYHRTGGLPAITHFYGAVGFFEEGVSKIIEELSVDDDVIVSLKDMYGDVMDDDYCEEYYPLYKI